MHAAPARYVSVSELYTTDEVELLLDEIRDLEPTSCRGEDVQDFEIAGSGVAGVGGAGAGGRSPAGTELTERSWDSHAQYSRAPPPPPQAIAPVYCAWRAAGWRGAALLLLAALGAAAAACVWAAAGRARLPLQPRVQLLQLGALTTAAAHGALLAARVTRLQALLPLRWDALALALAAWSCGALGAGGALTLHAVLLAPEYRWAPPHVANLLVAAAALGVCGSALAGGLAALGARAWRTRARARAGAGAGAAGASGACAYRAVPAAAPSAPSTSRDHAL